MAFFYQSNANIPANTPFLMDERSSPQLYPYFPSYWFPPVSDCLLVNTCESNEVKTVGFSVDVPLESAPTEDKSEKDIHLEEDLRIGFVPLNDKEKLAKFLDWAKTETLVGERSAAVFQTTQRYATRKDECCNCGSKQELKRMNAIILRENTETFGNVAEMSNETFCESFRVGLTLTERSFCYNCSKRYELFIGSLINGYSCSIGTFIEMCKKSAEKTYKLLSMQFSDVSTDAYLDDLYLYEVENNFSKVVTLTQYKPNGKHLTIKQIIKRVLIVSKKEDTNERVFSWVKSQ